MSNYLENVNGKWQLKKEYADKLEEIAKARKELDKEEEPIKKGVKLEAQDLCPSGANLGAYDYQVTATYLSLDFDLETLIRDYPEVYEKCCVPTYHKGITKLAPCKRTTKEK